MANEFRHVSVGTELSQTEYEAIGGHLFESQATGDTLYASSATQLSRLGIGSANQILQVSGGLPVWANPTTLALGASAVITTSSGVLTLTPNTDVHVTDAHGLVIGDTAQRLPGGATPEFQIIGTGQNDSSLALLRYSADVAGVQMFWGKSRGAAPGTNTTPNNGDVVGGIYPYIADTVDNDLTINIASFVAEVDGTPGNNDGPGRWVFNTTADGATVPTERLRINSAGVLILAAGEGGTTAPTGNTFRAPDIVTGGAGNIAGADLTIASGLGTGTGDVGTLIFSLPVVAAAGDNIQTRAARLTLDMAGGSSLVVQSEGTGAAGMILKNLKNAAASALSGTQLDIQIDIGGTPYYFTVFPTKA